jgi:hypothetical protein
MLSGFLINLIIIYSQELREKNWKAMDALSAAEKQQKVEIGKAVSSAKVRKLNPCHKMHLFHCLSLKL